jgi:pimeloyl-ACP methyl ester carboxylesterase
MRRILWSFLIVVLVLVLAAGATFYFAPLAVADLSIHLHLKQQHVMSEYVEVDGYRIHYFEAIPPRANAQKGFGTPLVLIHGLGSRGEDWSAMIPSLAARGFHVYAPDLLGYGRSPQPDVDYSIDLQEKTVVDFMQAVKLDQADIGGWSMGGWIALKLTVDHPDLVRRLIVYDAAGVYFPPTFDASLFTPSDSAGLFHLQQMLTPKPKPLPAFVARAAIAKLQSNAWVIDRSVTSMTGGKALLDFKLHLIKAPTLVVWGGEDKLIPIAVGKEMHDRIAGSSMLTIEGCGHLAPSECARPVIAGTLNFLSAVPPMRGVEKSVPGH